MEAPTVYRCARCRRKLLHPVMVAGMVMGSSCSVIVAGAAATMRRPTRAERKQAEREAEFASAQLVLI